MITTLRHLIVDSWIGRIIALLIFVAFIGWGANDVFLKPAYDNPNVLAMAGPSKISLQDYEAHVRLMGDRIAQAMGHHPGDNLSTPEKRQLRQVVFQSMLNELPMQAQAHAQGMVVPDKIIRNKVFSIPAFQDEQHHFNPDRFHNWLRNAQMTEPAFIDIVRREVENLTLAMAMARNITAPHAIVARFADYMTQRHVYDVATFRKPEGGSPQPAADEASFQRYYDNHPWDYTTQEYRHARIILLDASTLQSAVTASAAQIKALYDGREALYDWPEGRDIAYVMAKDHAQIESVAKAWRDGASWQDVLKQSKGAIADVLSQIPQSAIPAPELAKAAFAAAPDIVTGPISSPGGWIVFRVSKVTPAHHVSLDEARGGLASEIRTQEAVNQLPDKVAKLQDIVAGDTSLDHIPAELGARLVEGALTREGRTKSGDDALIPGNEAERKAIIDAIFSQKLNAPPRFVALPDGGAFVVKLDQVEPGRQLSFKESRDAVLKACNKDVSNRALNVAATEFFTQAKEKGGVSHVTVPGQGGPQIEAGQYVTVQSAEQSHGALPYAVLQTKIGETAMIDVDGTYKVFTVTSLPADPVAAHEARKALQKMADRGLQEDVINTFRQRAAERAKMHINQRLLNQVLSREGS
ncbi:MAG: SurA N-terminal domain-containing protein [Acetobacteraceae bacterium]